MKKTAGLTIIFATILVVAILAIVVGIIIAAPLLTILAVNTLFKLDIPFTLGTWAATFWLTMVYAPKIKTSFGSKEKK